MKAMRQVVRRSVGVVELRRWSSSSAKHPCLDRAFLSDFNPSDVEAGVYGWWDRARKEQNHRASTEKVFSMVIPPPNVTGQLHIGHALTVTVQDTLVRFHQMKGDRVIWVPGVDHAGIATQSVVEKQLLKQGLGTRSSIGREQFLRHVWDWYGEYNGRIDDQLKSLGASLDWDMKLFTMDDRSSAAVTQTFVELHRRGLIYRAERLVNWCPYLQTVISDLETEYDELGGPTRLKLPGRSKPVELGVMHEFAYPVRQNDSDGKIIDHLVVSTTRLETMLGDTGVAVHPDDPRYKHLHGCSCVHPFFPERKIPIVLDADLVDMELGTGAVKLTPAHDPNDLQCGARHELESITILNDDGSLVDNCGHPWAGMDRFDAREQLVKELDSLGLYRGKQPHAMPIARCSRSGDVIEPLLKPQWFVDCDSMAKRALGYVDDGKLEISPGFHKKTWHHFLENIQDWCISRQLWWGHRIPAYKVVSSQGSAHNTEESWVVATDLASATEQAGRQFGLEPGTFEVEQDDDVLDTWFSSAIFPLTALGWPDKSVVSTDAYPLSLMETGADILFFWVARMVMMCSELHPENGIPFRKVFLHPIVRDRQGRKMSKSLGNVIDPSHVINGASLGQLEAQVRGGNLPPSEVERAIKGMRKEFPKGIPACGADALRLALASYMHGGTTAINMDIDRVVTWRQFGNKLWNAQRFIMMQVDQATDAGVVSTSREEQDLTVEAKWILSRLASFVERYHAAMGEIELDRATQAIQRFVVSELCDVYIEAAKVRLKPDGDPVKKHHTLRVLVECMEVSLKLLHPFAPFLTDELWHRLLSDKRLRVLDSFAPHVNVRNEEHEKRPLCVETLPMPEHYKRYSDKAAESGMALVMDTVRGIRAVKELVAGVVDRDAMHRGVFVVCQDPKDHDQLQTCTDLAQAMGRAHKITVSMSPPSHPVPSLSQAVRPGVLIQLPLDVDSSARERIAVKIAELRKRMAKQEKATHKLQATLSSERYQKKAPLSVQETERKKLQDSIATTESITVSIQALEQIVNEK